MRMEATMQQETALSIEGMIALDLRIRELLSEANIPTKLDYWHRYSHYKQLLSQHVGFDAKVAALRSPACYETMIAALCKALAEGEVQV